ncbi:MAG: chemotaxis protein CheA [Gammaproteobacteria bacterium]|nr:chemotaxis protein CheA [Gammaproteobacteria bacterium]
MSMEEDDELLQDFLVEAGEILEQLGEQLVDLENSPDDRDLLNAVFRGFHTIKGGASFLNLDVLVALCHRSEDVFNILRNGERDVDTQVMDVILPVLDVLNEQFEAIRLGQTPEHASPELLKKLDQLAVPSTGSSEAPKGQEASAPVEHSDAQEEDLSAEEYQALMDSMDQAKGAASGQSEGSTDTPNSDEITEQEFDALLDNMQTARTGITAKDEPTKEQVQSVPVSDEITDDEFDALLDDLHSKGKPVSAQDKSVSQKMPTGNNAPLVNVDKKTPDVATEKPVSVSQAQRSEGKQGSAETQKTRAKSGAKQKEISQAESTVRVDTKRLDDIMNMVGELVLVRNRMATLENASSDEEMSKVVANLDVVTADLQAAVMKTRMQPIKKVFGRFPRVVRDLARSLNKEVNLELQGEETDLDKNLVEALADPLVHLVRNAVDHGIEMPAERESNNKPRSGTVILTAEQEGDHILLRIEDDGKGMDPDKLRKAAVDKGILDEEAANRLEPKDCYNLIFAPGFSTKQEISDVSGRGVGMDVVKTRIEQLNGSVEIDSKQGRGSVIIIKVPLTLAIMPTLMVMLETQIFALPLVSVNEIFHLDLTQTNVVDGQLVVMVRNKALPLFYLRNWLVNGAGGQSLPSEGHVVVVSMGVQRIGFVVDQLIGQEEVVIKPLGALLHGMKGLAGATITGDGRISLILDIPGLMQSYARRI